MTITRSIHFNIQNPNLYYKYESFQQPNRIPLTIKYSINLLILSDEWMIDWISCFQLNQQSYVSISFNKNYKIFNIYIQGSTLAVARWPGATRNWCRATKISKKLHFGGPIGQAKIPRWWCDENNIIRSRILPPFISDRKSKHPTFMFSVIRSRPITVNHLQLVKA